jgi:hypothetical protein
MPSRAATSGRITASSPASWSRPEPDGAQQPEAVLAETPGRLADGAYEPGREVLLSADEVEDRAGLGILEHAVDGEVAATGIGLGVGVPNPCGMAAVEHADILAEGRDLEGVSLLANQDDAERRADEDRLGEERLDLVRAGGGGEVIVLRLHAPQAVAHTSAGQQRLVARLAEPAREADGEVAVRDPGHRG